LIYYVTNITSRDSTRENYLTMIVRQDTKLNIKSYNATLYQSNNRDIFQIYKM